MPFMPEMLAYCGRQFRVAAVAHKTCDPAHKTGGRRLDNTVHLGGLRCDGSEHGGCQAACLLFWKTAWLKHPDAPEERPGGSTPMRLTEAQLWAATQAVTSSPEKPIYSCQATCLFSATRPLKWWDARQYVRDISSGNVKLRHALTFLFLSWLRALTRVGVAYRAARALYRVAHRLLVGRPAPEGGGRIPAGTPTPVRALNLQPGQWVRVRSNDEILDTITRDNKNRGMWFDDEATVFCGGEFQVERRVERIINEVTGEMLQMKTPCITLKGVQCLGIYSRTRLFCPRALAPYWREIWLELNGGRSPERTLR